MLEKLKKRLKEKLERQMVTFFCSRFLFTTSRRAREHALLQLALLPVSHAPYPLEVCPFPLADLA
jgi:hypothetical protein